MSKLVTDRGRSSAIVVEAVGTHANDLHTRLEARLERYLEGDEVMPDIALFVKIIARHIGRAAEELTTAHRAHEAELGDDVAPRLERDDAEVELRDLVVMFRNGINAAFDDGVLRAHSIYDSAPSDTRGLLDYAKGLRIALVDPALAPTARSSGGLVVDRAAMARELEPAIARLDAAVKVVTREASELTVTQTAKDTAMSANDTVFKTSANVMETLLLLADRKDLADRVRPSPRRPGVVENEVAVVVDPTTAT